MKTSQQVLNSAYDQTSAINVRPDASSPVFDTTTQAERVRVVDIVSFNYEVSLGRVAGKSHINKFGRTTNADNGVLTDVWDRANSADDQDIWVAPIQARIHQIVSSSANDKTTGTGAQTLRLFGLIDWDTKEVIEDIELDGSSNVATVNEYVIIHRMQILSKGGSGPNVGKITATADTDSSVTAQINVGFGQTQMAIYGVPSIQKFVMLKFYTTLLGASQAATKADVSLLWNPEPDVELTKFITRQTMGIEENGVSVLEHDFLVPKLFEGPAIIKIQVKATKDNSDISAGFDGILDNN